MVNDQVVVTKNTSQTQALGEEISTYLLKQEKMSLSDRLYCLSGELGSGKTQFVKGFAKGLGYAGRIISPTYVIIRSYDLGPIQFHHLDLYRLGSRNDYTLLELEQLVDDPRNILCIEWSENIPQLQSYSRHQIKLEAISQFERRINIKSISCQQ